MSLIEEIREAVINGQAKVVVPKVQQALDDGVAADQILHDGLIDAMREVGRMFEEGEYFVPEMLIAARAMKAALEILKPHLVDQGVEPLGRIAIGTVKGDLHDIGKSLVAMMLEGAGFEVIDLGVDVPPEKFIDQINGGAQIVAMSALLTTTMPNMKTTIEAIESAGLRNQVKVMVGGAPVTQTYAQQIGADGFSEDASSAVRTAVGLIEK
ncbi:MAG TPA: corrinoid protein [Aggregatilinea sp.]|uniref:cobalamin B12-binding domain-containing protein n=1 Tax=Aggregatilinea sp. TaxID=2806333 RepID=UPI002CCBAFB4|nr:corrinoid protein [Aggregatilinea sp.]HML22606.1 corrinoid protein [Aggregatilinea sp.]